METWVFWRDIEARFRAIPDSRQELDASRGGDYQEFFDDQCAGLAAAVRNPLYPLDAIASLAQQTAHIGTWFVDGVYVVEWIVSGGWNEGRHRFCSEAVLGAKAAGLCPDAGLTADAAIDRWLSLLARRRSPYYRGDEFPFIRNLTIASADLCAQLASEAYQGATPTVVQPPASDPERETAEMRLSDARKRAKEVGDGDGQGAKVVETAVVAPKPLDASPLLTVKKAAELLKCHEDTVRAMGRRGDIEIVKTGPRLQRIKASEILRLRSKPKFSDR